MWTGKRWHRCAYAHPFAFSCQRARTHTHACLRSLRLFVSCAHVFNCGEKFQFDYKLNKWFNQFMHVRVCVCECECVFLFFTKFKMLQTISLYFVHKCLKTHETLVNGFVLGHFSSLNSHYVAEKRGRERGSENKRKHFVCTGKKRSIFNTYVTCIRATTRYARDALNDAYTDTHRK